MYAIIDFRDYQYTDYLNIQQQFKTHLSVLYQAPTGSGKSVVISRHILDCILMGRKVLFIANRTHLQNQMYRRLQNLGVQDSNIFSASNKKALNGKVILSTTGALIAPQNFELLKTLKVDDVVIDECHRSVTKSYMDVLELLSRTNPNMRLFGVTATPNRFDLKPLKTLYNTMVSCSKSMAQLVEDGYLAKYRVFTVPMEDLEAEIESHGGDFVMESMSKYMRNPRVIKKCIEQYETYAKSRSAIIYCVDKKHTKQLQEAYAKAGHTKSVIIDESVSDKEREVMFEQFATGEINIIFCIETLTEGLDLPNCNAIQLCRPTKSMIFYLQMVGRALRPKEDGGDAVILDSALNVSRLGMPTSDIHWDLEGKRIKKQTNKGKVVVYKDMSGNIFFNQDENIPMAEMVEVNFGDLAEMGESMITVAEEANAKVYMEFYTQFRELCLHILHGAGIEGSDIIFRGEPNVNDADAHNTDSISFNIKTLSEISFEMEIDSRNKDLIKVNTSGEYNIDRSKLSGYIKHNKFKGIVGDIHNFINHDINNILNNMASIRINPDDLQNIRELKDLKNTIDENNFNNAVEAQLKKDGRVYIELEKWFSLNDYSSALGYARINVLCIVDQKQFQANNRTIFFTKDAYDNLIVAHYSKSVKRDRLSEIIKYNKGKVLPNTNKFGKIGDHTLFS